MTARGIERRVDYWRRKLAPEWRITISDEAKPDDSDPQAAIRADENYHHATLYIAPDTRRAILPELDVTIVHELLHLHMREMRRTLDLVEGQVNRDVHSLLEERFLGLEEQTVERLARIIAKAEHPDGLVYGVLTDD